MDDVATKRRRPFAKSRSRTSRLAALSLIALFGPIGCHSGFRASVRRRRIRFQIGGDVGRRLMHLTSTLLVVVLLVIISTIAWVLLTSVDQASETREETGEIAVVGEIGAEFHQEVAVADQLVSEMLLKRLASAPFRSSTTRDTIGAAEDGEPLPISHPSFQRPLRP